MALTKATFGVTNISDLSSTPNATEGLTAAQLQAKFDKTGADGKTYINDTLVDELDTLLGDVTSADIAKLHDITASATELNYVDGVTSAIQTQINDKCIGITLYSDATGTTNNDDITLSETSANFSYLEIFGYAGVYYTSVKVDAPNGKSALMNTLDIASTGVEKVYLCVMAISGVTIDLAINRWISRTTAGTATKTEGGFYVTKVVGYR